MRAAWLLFAKFFAATLMVAKASARTPAATGAPVPALAWSGPGAESGCLGASGLARAVDDYLGRASFAPGPSAITVGVALNRRESFGWRAVVRIQGESGTVLGERELVSEHEACSSLDEPLTLAVALMVDSELTPPPEEAAEDPVREKAITEPAGRPYRSRPRVDASLIGLIDALPAPTAGIDLGGELGLTRWFALRAHLSGVVPRSQTDDDAQARFGLFLGGVQACTALAWDALEVGPCLGLDGGLLTAKSGELTDGESSTSRFWGGSASARARVRLSRSVSAWASAGALLPYRRDRFVYRDEEGQRRLLFRSASVLPFATVGVSLEL